jgi:hypothetical protein
MLTLIENLTVTGGGVRIRDAVISVTRTSVVRRRR